MKKILCKIFFVFVFNCSLLTALFSQPTQNNYKIILLDESGTPVKSATTTVSTLKGKMLATIFSDSTGVLTISKAEDSIVRINITHVGYFTYEKNINFSSAISDTIYLKRDANQLATVTVEGKRPMIVVQPDRYVLTIDGNINFGNTVTDVLKKAPGITIVNDVVYLEGKPVMLQVNGKNLPLSGKELLSYISSSSSTSVNQIELITTPPASMDAAFAGGVINLKLARRKGDGTNGNITLEAGGRSKYPYSAIDGNLNYRHGKLNIYASAGVYAGKQVSETLTQRIFQEAKPLLIDEKSNGSSRTHSVYYTAGADYYFNRMNTAGILITGSYDETRNELFNRSSILSGGKLDSINRFTFVNPRINALTVINFNYKRLLDTLGQEFNVDVDYNFLHSDNEGRQTYNYLLPDEKEYKSPLYVVQKTFNSPKLIGVKLDYRKKIKTALFEAGVKYALTKIGYNLDETRDQNVPATHLRIRDTFNYNENIYAAYASLSGKWKQWNYRAGLRTEYTNFDAYSFTNKQDLQNDYINLFPTIAFSRQLNAKNNINFSVRRSIVRPRFNQLNPFNYFLSPFYYYTGNPQLQPYFPYSVRFGHSFMNRINTYIAYSYSNDRITEISFADTSRNLIYTNKQNNGKMKALQMGTSYINELTKWWYTNNGLNVSLSKFTFSPEANKTQTFTNNSFSIYSTQRFTLPKNISLELYLYYNSPAYYDVAYTKSYWFMDFSAAKQIFAGNGELSVGVNDIFYSNITRTETKYGNVNFTTRNKWDSRIYFVKLFYRFGNKDVRGNRQRNNTATNEERSRAR